MARLVPGMGRFYNRLHGEKITNQNRYAYASGKERSSKVAAPQQTSYNPQTSGSLHNERKSMIQFQNHVQSSKARNLQQQEKNYN